MNSGQDLIYQPGNSKGFTEETFSVKPQPVQTDAIITVAETEPVSYVYHDTLENSRSIEKVNARLSN